MKWPSTTGQWKWVPIIISFLLVCSLHSAELSDDYKAQYDRAAALFKEGKLEEALQALDAADAAQPNLPHTNNLRGAILVRQKKLDLAAAEFRRALELQSDFNLSIYNLGEVAFLKKEFETALKQYQAFLAAMPDNELGLYKVFLCQLMLGQHDKAKAFMTQHPRNWKSPLNFFLEAAWHFKQGNRAEAEDILGSAFRIYPSQLNAIFIDSMIELGWVDPQQFKAIGAITIR